jgi:hypothetical protein
MPNSLTNAELASIVLTAPSRFVAIRLVNFRNSRFLTVGEGIARFGDSRIMNPGAVCVLRKKVLLE